MAAIPTSKDKDYWATVEWTQRKTAPHTQRPMMTWTVGAENYGSILDILNEMHDDGYYLVSSYTFPAGPFWHRETKVTLVFAQVEIVGKDNE